MAVVTALAVAGCGPVTSRTQSDNPVALQVAWHKGESVRYHLDFKVATRDSSQPRTENSKGSSDLTLQVLSVDSAGTARIKVSADHVVSYVDGKKQAPAAAQSKPIIVDVARDGRVTVEGRPTTPAVNSSLGGFFGGLLGAGASPDSALSNNEPFQFFPQGKVKPGATWTSSYDYPSAQQPAYPGLQGSIHARVTNKFTGYDSIAGRDYAVVDSSSSVPVNLVFDLSAYLRSVAPKASSQSGDSIFNSSKPILIRFDGDAGWHVKSRVDTATDELYSTTAHAALRIGFNFRGPSTTPPSDLPASSVSISADVSLQRL